MSQVVKHDDMDAANTIRFEKISETTSKALLQHTADLGMAVKLMHLETESLRSVKESLHSTLVKALKEELSTSAESFGSQLFSVFCGKATTFLDSKFSSVNVVNDDLKKTVRAWSNLSFKSLSLLAVAAVLIGVGSFFSSHYLMASHRLTGEEKKLLAFGRSLANNFSALKPEAQKILKEGVSEWKEK